MRVVVVTRVRVALVVTLVQGGVFQHATIAAHVCWLRRDVGYFLLPLSCFLLAS